MLQDTKQTVVSKAIYTAVSYRYLFAKFPQYFKANFSGKRDKGNYYAPFYKPNISLRQRLH